MKRILVVEDEDGFKRPAQGVVVDNKNPFTVFNLVDHRDSIDPLGRELDPVTRDAQQHACRYR